MQTTILKTKTEFVKDLYDAFGRGDIQFIIDHLSNDIEWNVVGKGGLPYGGEYKGKNEVLEFFRALSIEVEIIDFAYNEFIESDNKVIAFGTYGVRIKDSNAAPYFTDWIMSWEFEGGLPVKFDDYFDSYNVYKALY